MDWDGFSEFILENNIPTRNCANDVTEKDIEDFLRSKAVHGRDYPVIVKGLKLGLKMMGRTKEYYKKGK